jgi:hypothetical protein
MIAETVLAAVLRFGRSQEKGMNPPTHLAAPDHLPGFITGPGETDVLMVVAAVLLIVAILAVGNLFLRLHTLPERMAHKSQKLQFEIVAVLGLLALFTHIHLFWVIGLILAMIDLPDFGSPLRRIAASTEKLAGIESNEDEGAAPPNPPGIPEPELRVEGSAPKPREATEQKHA